MRQCSAIKANGERCSLPAQGQQDVCWAHSPQNREKRRQTASKGGKSKASREIREIKAKIQAIIDELEAGTRDRGDASVMFQGYRALKDFIELERKREEVDQIAREIEELKRELRAG